MIVRVKKFTHTPAFRKLTGILDWILGPDPMIWFWIAAAIALTAFFLVYLVPMPR